MNNLCPNCDGKGQIDYGTGSPVLCTLCDGKKLAKHAATFLSQLLGALGKTSGTLEECLEEVKRLRENQTMVEIGKVNILGSVVWKDFAGIYAYKKIGLRIYAISREKALGLEL